MEILAFLTPLGVDNNLFHASGNQTSRKFIVSLMCLQGITLCILGENSHKFSSSKYMFSHLLVSSFEYCPTCTFQLLLVHVLSRSYSSFRAYSPFSPLERLAHHSLDCVVIALVAWEGQILRGHMLSCNRPALNALQTKGKC